MSSSPADPYPMTLSTVYIEKPWGGRALERFKGDLPEGPIGETWDVSAQEQGVCEVTDGPLRGLGLDRVAALLGRALLGSVPPGEDFPLMVRHVSSREPLSVQVHPTAAYARATGQRSGKDEAWYVLDAGPGASVYAGVAGASEAEFKEAVRRGTVCELLVDLPVTPGDCVFIPAGMVHGIRADVTLVEICENSNTTYRVFDYGRDRGLDVEETFANMDLARTARAERGITVETAAGTETLLCLQPTMGLARLDIAGAQPQSTRGESFHALTCLDGAGAVAWAGGEVGIERGRSVLVPAALGEFTLDGDMRLLRSWVPDCDRTRRELLSHSV